MSRAAVTPAQQAQALELRAAGLSWQTIGRRLGVSAKVLWSRLAGRPGVKRRVGPAGRPLGSGTGPVCLDLYQQSLGRAWRSRGWSWEAIAGALRVPKSTVRRWCR